MKDYLLNSDSTGLLEILEIFILKLILHDKQTPHSRDFSIFSFIYKYKFIII